MSFLQEAIFRHARALHQSGQMKSTIYASGHTVFILNMDNTVILRFVVSKRDLGIESEISFVANDYYSDDFREEDGRIIFTRKEEGFIQEKSCRAPDMTFTEVEELWDKYVELDRKQHHNQKMTLADKFINMLDLSLSHLEIKSEDKRPIITQRDIYTGAIITTKIEEVGLGKTAEAITTIKEDFGPIGIRTEDFIALFAYNDHITFYFHPTSPFMLIQGEKLSMSGVLAGCVYDEMGETMVIIDEKEDKEDGRQEPKNRRGKQKTDTKPNETLGKEGNQTTVRRRGKRREEKKSAGGGEECGTGLLNPI